MAGGISEMSRRLGCTHPSPEAKTDLQVTQSICMNFLLDTDIVSYALRGSGRVAAHIKTHRLSALAVSAISIAELRFGADRLRSIRLHRLIDGFTSGIRVLPFTETAAHRYGVVAAVLERQGISIGQMDCQIAAHALSDGLTLVSNNTSHFERVRGLKLVNWFN